MLSNNLGVVICLICVFLVRSELPSTITIDGHFEDWVNVKQYTDPQDNEDGSVLQDDVPDCHNITENRWDKPVHIFNTHVDIIQYALAHDDTHLYAYIKTVGDMALTFSNGTDAGQTNIIVAVDIDDNVNTGYCLSSGGLFPDGCGFDINLEIEFYNGSFNLATTNLHAMKNLSEEENIRSQLQKKIVNFGPATYKLATQWVYWDSRNPITPPETARCPDGPHVLPGSTDQALCFVGDKCDCRFSGAMNYSFSEDRHMIEFSVPFAQFMNSEDGTPAVELGKRITAVFAIKTTPEYSIPRERVSDATWPIRGYVLLPHPNAPPKFDITIYIVGGFIGLFFGITISGTAVFVWTRVLRPRFNQRSYYAQLAK